MARIKIILVLTVLGLFIASPAFGMTLKDQIRILQREVQILQELLARQKPPMMVDMSYLLTPQSPKTIGKATSTPYLQTMPDIKEFLGFPPPMYGPIMECRYGWLVPGRCCQAINICI